ncbi:MAG: hypothetical protein KatS3mg131_3648 [Candidatus Tectimicrobiota bacterium]|nr:MAG: hypothetical protein KatS3mg131_3648 [Candidatus Tectomicrobia bacterium]
MPRIELKVAILIAQVVPHPRPKRRRRRALPGPRAAHRGRARRRRATRRQPEGIFGMAAEAYAAAVRACGWEATHRQVLRELKGTLAQHLGPLADPAELAEQAYWLQWLVLAAAWSELPPAARPTPERLDALFCEVFGALGHAVVNRRHREKATRVLYEAETIVARALDAEGGRG